MSITRILIFISICITCFQNVESFTFVRVNGRVKDPTIRSTQTRTHTRQHSTLRQQIRAREHDDDDETTRGKPHMQQQLVINTRRETFLLRPDDEKISRSLRGRRFFRPWRKHVQYKQDDIISFEYDYNELLVPVKSSSTSKITDTDDGDDDGTASTPAKPKPKKSRIVLLIQPIGVGIGRWYYDRLLQQFQSSGNDLFRNEQKARNFGTQFECEYSSYVFLAPDLLGCGSACHPSLVSSANATSINAGTKKSSISELPLLTVKDWSEQLISLMVKYEQAHIMNTNDDEIEVEWCVVSNGGCVPIAFDIATRYIETQPLTSTSSSLIKKQSQSDADMFQGRLTDLILSATPRAMSLMRPQDLDKIHKSYRILSGIVGRLFWWYSLRRNGAFIQKFSEKNLAANAENLGEEWTPKCVETARTFQGRSRYSTFAFLAGSLNGGNEERLKVLKENVKGMDLNINIITGGDKRINPAKSWFWQNRKEMKKAEALARQKDAAVEKTTLLNLLLEMGVKCEEIVVKGRRCPAHEDAEGFARAVATILQK